MSKIVHIKSLAESCRFSGMEAPAHPLIMIVRQWPKAKYNLDEVKFTSDLYYVALKRSISGSFLYGRSSYDYQEGTMVFIAPGQVASFSAPSVDDDSSNGWALLFHPDLIRRSELGKMINSFSFFNYEVNEALHLSEKERESINHLVNNIEQEINARIDKHSNEIIVQNLHTLFKYCLRYYERQFYVRSNINKDIVTRFEHFLQHYFSSNELAEQGLPSLKRCGEELNISGSYLSDLLRVETGKSATDHIYSLLIERAKTKLLSTNDTISEIAYAMGFEYPQNFTKLFKQKTGMSPKKYRNLN
ncbi:MAG TPA: helix-turn-helix transcriptional regulator [Saprospiraceae bacterium]|nr:helix-turn-helix transcriptional regulator [Saprospiraceae bacterium]